MHDFSKIIRNAAHCLLCGDIIESRHRHDWVQCKCGNVFVDGGHDYCRAGYSDGSNIRWLNESRPWSLDELNQREEELVNKLVALKETDFMAKYYRDELSDLLIFRNELYYNDLGLPEDE